MNITILCEYVSGTGGGKAVINAANTLVENWHNVSVYTRVESPQAVTKLMNCPCRTIDNIKNNADVVIAFNLNKRIGEVFYDLKGRKIFRVSCYVPEYAPFILDKSIIKFATTTYVQKLISAFDSNVKCIFGPVNTKWYYRDNVERTNLILFYSQKDGWVGITVANIIHKKYPNLIIASLGNMGISSSPVKPDSHLLNLGAPGEMIDYSRFIYNKASVFYCCESAGPWGYNNCVIEAQLCKCPVVSTDWDDLKDTVIPGVTAITAPHNGARELPWQDWFVRPDPELIAEEVIQLYNNKELCRTLTENAYNYAERFSNENWYANFIKLVEEA